MKLVGCHVSRGVGGEFASMNTVGSLVGLLTPPVGTTGAKKIVGSLVGDGNPLLGLICVNIVGSLVGDPFCV